jgi:ribonuclease-3
VKVPIVPPPDIELLQEALGYRFSDRSLLSRALTHSSSVNEAHAGKEHLDNERLEFLGDSVLGWLVSEWLFTHFPEFREGQLSVLKNYIVSAAHLLAAAHRLDLGRFLHLGRGEETGGGRSKQRLLVNAFEAIVAAVYLDGGAPPARHLVLRYAMPGIEELRELAGAAPPQDHRAQLERLAQEHNLPRPVYEILNETGPGHARVFTVEVRLGRNMARVAEGPSKKSASQAAAREVCDLLRADRTSR